MASFIECLEAAVAAGRVPRETAEELLTKAKDLESKFVLDKQHSPESAARLAEEMGIRAVKSRVRLQRYQMAKQAIANARNVADILGHRRGPAVGLVSILRRDLHGEARNLNVDMTARSITAQAHSIMANALDQTRAKVLGFYSNKELLRKVVRELFGESTGDATAKGAADSWTSAAEYLRGSFNRAGGAIPKRADWGLPQSHDAVRIHQAGKQAWLENIVPKIDRARMADINGAPLSDGEFTLLMEQIFHTIESGGLSDLTPTMGGRGKKLANQRADRRVLVFKSADDWFDYQQDFGAPDIFHTMTGHMDGMGRDIALLQILGPNPHAAFNMLRSVVEKHGGKPGQLGFLNSTYNVVSGRVNGKTGAYLADFFGNVRNVLIAAKLGSAVLSAVSDTGFLAVTALWNGMSATVTLARAIQLMAPGGAERRLAAVRMGLGARAWTEVNHAANRFSEVSGSKTTARMADLTIRTSGLAHWTDSMRKAFGMEFMAFVQDSAHLPFGKLPAPLKRSLERGGFSPDEWDLLRATRPMEFDGAKYMSVENVLAREDLTPARKQNLSTKLQQILFVETNHAVPEPDAVARTITTGGAQSDTIAGQIFRNVFLFKSFPVSAIATHLYRGIYQTAGPLDAAKYMAQVVISTTVMGAVALQMKEIVRGKDPRPMRDRRFWAAAFLQGGGAGLFGDLLFNDVNRFGGGLVKTFAGPTVDIIDDAAKLTLGNLQQLAQGKNPEIAVDLIRAARRYTPGGSLWYLRAGLEREVFDQLSQLADPQAQRKFNRLQRIRRRKYGQGYWWKPGARTPDRAPDLANILEEAPPQ